MRPSPACAALVLVCGMAAPGLAAPREAVEERPWAGLLPDPRQGFGGSRSAGEGDWFAVLLRDAETGAPLPGARLVRTPESIAGWRLRHDMVMAVGIADADGIARVPVQGSLWKDDCHWLALAEGHAPDHDYGAEPEPEMFLPRGQPFRARVLDPMGRPVAGALVENLGGCSHGTAAQRSIAASDGVVTFPHSEPSFGQLWIEGPGIASDLMAFSDPISMGRAPAPLAMETGYRFEGRVVDLLGEPIAGVVVRHYNEQRGPVTMTDGAGQFVLHGVERREASLVLYPPLDLSEGEGGLHVDDGVAGTPMTVVLTPLGPLEEEASARVRVRCRLPDGGPAGDVGYRILSARTGRGPVGTTANDVPVVSSTDEPLGEAVENVVPGRIRVVPRDPFEAFEFDPVEAEARGQETTVVEIAVRPRPVLRIRGAVPERADLTLSLEDDSLDAPGESASWTPRLPADGPAALRVQVPKRPPFFFPVGPAREGVREVEVVLPDPVRIRLPTGTRDAELFEGAREAVGFRVGDHLLTDAVGHLTLRFTDAARRTLEVPLELPETRGAEIGVDPAVAKEAPKQVEVRILEPSEDGSEVVYDTVARDPGRARVVTRAGWRTLRWTPADGATLRWGDASIELQVAVEPGGSSDAIALIDGELYAMPEGRLALRGFQAGPHRALLALRDRPGSGRELRFTLVPRGKLEHTVILGAE